MDQDAAVQLADAKQATRLTGPSPVVVAQAGERARHPHRESRACRPGSCAEVSLTSADVRIAAERPTF